MTVTTKTYNVNQFKQLIELNETKTNFDINFEIKSKDNRPFKALVISESDLNSGNPIKYQDVAGGYISGNVNSDKGIFQTYFLLLKSDEPTECDVTLDIKDIPLNPLIQNEQQMQQQQMQQQQMQQQQMQQQQMQQQQMQQQQIRNPGRTQHNNGQPTSNKIATFKPQTNIENFTTDTKNGESNGATQKKSNFTFWIIFGVCAVLVLGWFYYKNKLKSSNISSNTIGVGQNIQVSSPVQIQTQTIPNNIPIQTIISNNIPAQINTPPQNSFPETSLNTLSQQPVSLPVSTTNFEIPQELPSTVSTVTPSPQFKTNDDLLKKLNSYFSE